MPKEIIVNWERLPQIRRDPFIPHRTVIISAQRQLRARKEAEVVAYQNLPEILEGCVFCPGNEEQTPKELVRIESPIDKKQWLVRGFPNAFPILMIEEGDEGNNHEPFFKQYIKKGIGAHELIVESPKHNVCLSCLTEEEIASIFDAMTLRYWDLGKDSRFGYFFAFKNYGPPGASQDHPHWQIETRVFAPKTLHEKIQTMREYWINEHNCLLCRLWQEEKADGRMVSENDDFTAYVPFAPSEPFELIIVPKQHSACFAIHLQDRSVAFKFASILKEVMVKVKKTLQGENWSKLFDPPYHIGLYTAPYQDQRESYYHWHLLISFHTTYKVGHERGTGEDVIPAFPEEIAAILRAA